LYVCEYPNCGAEYTSALAAAFCEDDDRERDANTQGWFTRKDVHRKD
jgi:hypothetical protein